jgi:hypothetical protein
MGSEWVENWRMRHYDERRQKKNEGKVLDAEDIKKFLV